MPKQSAQSHRKDEHYFLAEKFYQEAASAGFDQVRFVRSALPETAVSDVQLGGKIASVRWNAPIFINAMTGGSPTTGKLNASLARIAARLQLPIASGSASVIFSDPSVKDSFTVIRAENPSGTVIANIGADKTPAQAQQVVELLHADLLEVHINAVQELVMPEGERNYHWLANIQAIIAAVTVPVIVKEVGFGMRQDDFAALQNAGATVIDVGGHGGTNFAKIENARVHGGGYEFLADFGQNTVESLLEGQNAGVPLIATGGIRTPLDVLKALRLGADAVGIAGLILHWLTRSGEDECALRLANFITQINGVAALLGASNLQQLRQVPVVYGPKLRNYVEQRGLALL
ncbi:type 2 isopentenyl-diphosphate Delta-isomerase [Lacticaseibacillus zhaodongensis]|uniref:type 2 isopentenyl-diphosphate Delta-isomerase n=1 Tax=Lacticaseibacillus zhaodongensis TaxID=2668065 RepID=UPI001E35E0AC|nr:type 2 isopentenyl-diphosphate Delta-isomerase [Lacticaseibacillus zhaodongensis]